MREKSLNELFEGIELVESDEGESRSDDANITIRVPGQYKQWYREIQAGTKRQAGKNLRKAVLIGIEIMKNRCAQAKAS